MTIDENGIIRAIQEGDREAYAELVRFYHGRILRLCQVLLSDSAEAEDAAQDAFIKAYESLSSFRGDAAFSTWITRIAHNQCLDRLRRRSRRKTDSLTAIDESSLPAVQEIENDDAQRALAALRPEYKEILALREVAGLTYEEIAANLRCSLDAVKARLRRARKELRHFFTTADV